MGDSFYLYYPPSLWNRDGGSIGSLTSGWTRGTCGAHTGDILSLLDPAVIVLSFVDLRNHVRLPFSNVDLKIPMCVCAARGLRRWYVGWVQMSMVDPVVPTTILERIQQAMNEVGT